MKKSKIPIISIFIIIIAVNFSIVGNISNNNGYLSLASLNLAFADPGEGGGSECDVIISPGGGGTAGAILAEVICSESWPILKMEAECIWSGNCEDICMFADEHDCEAALN